MKDVEEEVERAFAGGAGGWLRKADEQDGEEEAGE